MRPSVPSLIATHANPSPDADDFGPWVASTVPGNETVAAVTYALEAPLALRARRPAEVWAGTVFLDRAEVRGAGAPWLPAVLYAALQQGRCSGKTTVAAWSGPGGDPIADILQLAPPSAWSLKLPGRGRLVAQTLDVAMQAAFEHCHAEARAVVAQGFVPEIEQAVERFVERFMAGPWVRAIRAGTLSREQYIHTLYSMHQYVRFTTRLLGRAVSLCPDTVLRTHYLDHLAGEKNHERIIERDLAHLGVDATYLRDTRCANAATRSFMVVQQSLVAFEQDPILFMASPLAAEGITAHLDGAFLDALLRNVSAWGVDDPRRATQFLASHVDFDGGDDGHWENTLGVLRRALTEERRQREFLTLLELSTSAIAASFDANVAELSLFSPVAGS